MTLNAGGRSETGPRTMICLVLLTVWQAGSWRVGLVVTIGLAVTTVTLHLAGALLVRLIKPLSRSRWFALRHAVLQLSRPGSQVRIVLLAVGLGSFFILGVRSLQQNLISEFAVDTSPDAPDMFWPPEARARTMTPGMPDSSRRSCIAI